MLRHIVMLNLREEVTDMQVTTLVEALRDLGDQIEEIASVEVGVDLGLAPGNHRVVLVLDVADEPAWRRYQAHPAHRAVIADRIKPLLASRASLQFYPSSS